MRSQVRRTSSKARRDATLAWGLAAFIAVFRREQTTACAVVSLHVGVGVILTAKPPNCRRSRRPFGGRDDAGPRSRNTGERKWTRPHCSSSSSWCCCSAAADSSLDAGVESDGRFARRDCSSPYARTPLPRAVADLGGIGDRTLCFTSGDVKGAACSCNPSSMTMSLTRLGYQVHVGSGGPVLAARRDDRVPLRYTEADIENDLAVHRELGILRGR